MINTILPKELAGSFSNHQQIFVRYTLFILIDLTVLNLFSEFWDHVYISSFSISLLAAVLLQILLKLTLVIEHRMAHYFKSKSGTSARVLRIFSTWAVLFISKLLILEAINYLFADDVVFSGPIHGLVSFIVVVTGILVAEQIMIRIYNSLA